MRSKRDKIRGMTCSNRVSCIRTVSSVPSTSYDVEYNGRVNNCRTDLENCERRIHWL
jgi:hypothetical protein